MPDRDACHGTAVGCSGDTHKGMQARLLLVHSPLVRGGAWKPVADDLAGDGYAVTVPDLADTAPGPPKARLRQLRRPLADRYGFRPMRRARSYGEYR